MMFYETAKDRAESQRRRVSKYWEEKTKKTSAEWCKHLDVVIMDPDGWDRKSYDYSFNEERISFKEFTERKSKSTTLII
jgi:hypothetical protein